MYDQPVPNHNNSPIPIIILTIIAIAIVSAALLTTKSIISRIPAPGSNSSQTADTDTPPPTPATYGKESLAGSWTNEKNGYIWKIEISGKRTDSLYVYQDPKSKPDDHCFFGLSLTETSNFTFAGTEDVSYFDFFMYNSYCRENGKNTPQIGATPPQVVLVLTHSKPDEIRLYDYKNPKLNDSIVLQKTTP